MYPNVSYDATKEGFMANEKIEIKDVSRHIRMSKSLDDEIKRMLVKENKKLEKMNLGKIRQATFIRVLLKDGLQFRKANDNNGDK